MPHSLTIKCCVPNCGKTRLDGTILHIFPNPEKDPDRFRTWLYAIGGDILALENKKIFKYRRVCHHHFQTRFYTTSNRLCANAVPTLNLPGKKPVFTGLQNVTRNLMSKSLYYSEFGDPLNVVKFREIEVPPLKSQEVLVRMLAAPVNPADINTIQGKYPVKITLPVIPGNEGVGIVEEIGSDVKNICPGNRVIVIEPMQGTWRDIGVFSKDVLRVVPDNLGLVEAATLTVNPCTAYRMLSDFKNVKDGQVVIQNGANSACGQNVIQICKAWGIKNINIVRSRPEIKELKKYLECLGATYVLTEEELRTTTLFKEKQIRKPILALNCVGGKSALEIVRHLDKNGVMVTYGAMSRDPVTIPNAALIFQNISFHGFWMTAWREEATEDEKEKMMADIVSLMCEKKLVGPVHKMVKFENYEEALGNALSSKGFTGCKYILDFSC